MAAILVNWSNQKRIETESEEEVVILGDIHKQISTYWPITRTETAEAVEMITDKQIADLPLNGRNFMQLLQLTSGVVSDNDDIKSQKPGQKNISRQALVKWK
jgi:hypothetical protein